MEKVTVMALCLLIAAAVCAPQNKLNSDSSVSNRQTSLMTYEELEYILRTKRGEPGVLPKKLSPCARAILGCCNGIVMNSHCSESLKCGAFFFDDNPCEEEFVISALKAASVFYNQFN